MTDSYHRNKGLFIFLGTGVLAGALVFLGLWLLCVFMSSGFSVMGVQSAEIGKLVWHEFLGTVIWVQVRILITYLVIGGFLGLVGAITCLGFSRGFIHNRSRWWAVSAGVLSSLVFEFLFLLWAIQRTPQMFADFFYIPGGWTRQAMVFITDQLPVWIVPCLLLGLTGIFVITLILLVLKSGSITREWKNWNGAKLASIVILFGIAFLIIFGVQLSHANKESTAPGIVILGADSFRWDHISGLGYHRHTTPAIDELIKRGTVFSNAITPLPRTFPAWVSYLTGTYPKTHGIQHMFPTVADRQRIPPAAPKILAEQGWQCGVISDFAGDVFSRIDLGFQTVEAPEFNFITLIKMHSLEIHWALLPIVNTRIGRQLFPVLREFAQAGYPEYLGHEARKYLKKQVRKGNPFFLTVFFSATHFPYAAPEPFYHEFADRNYQGDFKYHKPNLLKTHEALTSEDIDHIIGLYDGAVKAVDDEIGKIIHLLEETGLSKRTWIIITADHGENLYEGELGMGHGEHLRGMHVLKVPLIIIPPQGTMPAIAKVEVPVSGVDLAPTLLDMAGIPPKSNMEGSSLLPLLEGDSETAQKFQHRPVFSETGIWFADWTEGFYQQERIQYPDVSRLCRLDRFHDNQIVLKEEARDLVEAAKHRMVIKDGLKLIEIPTREGITEEIYRIDPAGNEFSIHPTSSEIDTLRMTLYDFFTSGQAYTEKEGYLIPKGSDWRLNRKVVAER
jgi:arylsulfatase A-like enzyme